jgi:replication factor C subunit 3/5
MSVVPWTEKYRPQIIDDVIGQKNSIFKKFIEKKFLPNMIFHGESGIGKTSLIYVIINEIYDDSMMFLIINASEERGIDVIRDKVYQFSMNGNIMNSNIPKLIVLDEVDALTIEAQNMLGKIINMSTKFIRFCLICNQLKNIDLSLQSKCIKFHLNVPSLEEIKNKINKIIELEKITITENGINCLLDKTKDMRKILNILQTMHCSKEYIDESTINKYLSYPTKKEIDDLYDKLLNESFNNIFIYFDNLIQNGNSVFDILGRLIDKMMYDNKLNLKIIKELGKMEAETNLCPQNMICSYIISIFIKYRKII